MKMRVIQVRGNSDYVDIHTLVSHGVDVLTGLAGRHAATSAPVLQPLSGLSTSLRSPADIPAPVYSPHRFTAFTNRPLRVICRRAARRK
jgi:hypothetical protein